QNIISAELHVDFEGQSFDNWVIKKDDITNLSIYYVENDSIKLDFYDLKEGIARTFTGLSEAYCDVPFVLYYTEKSNEVKPSRVLLNVLESELPDRDKIVFSKLSEDTLYLKMVEFKEN